MKDFEAFSFGAGITQVSSVHVVKGLFEALVSLASLRRVQRKNHHERMIAVVFPVYCRIFLCISPTTYDMMVPIT